MACHMGLEAQAQEGLGTTKFRLWYHKSAGIGWRNAKAQKVTSDRRRQACGCMAPSYVG